MSVSPQLQIAPPCKLDLLPSKRAPFRDSSPPARTLMDPPQSVVFFPLISVIWVKVRCAPDCTLKLFDAPFASSVTLLPPLMVTLDVIERTPVRVMVVGRVPQSNKISFAVLSAVIKAVSSQLAVIPLPTVTRPSGRVRKVWSAP